MGGLAASIDIVAKGVAVAGTLIDKGDLDLIDIQLKAGRGVANPFRMNGGDVFAIGVLVVAL